MAFRDHLAAATTEKDAVSVIHGMWEHSRENGHPLTIFENIIECPGQRAAVNLLTRERLCAAIGISPEDYIDTLGWAMSNPQQPQIISPNDSPCFENIQEEVDIGLKIEEDMYLQV
jgi:hypothetical protein